MSCAIALALALLAAPEAGAVAATTVPAATARAPLATEPMYADIVRRATALGADLSTPEQVAAKQAFDAKVAEVRAAADEDLPEAIGFVKTSAAKMDRLIGAILKLSREGRRNLVAEPLDMRALLGNVLASLHQQARASGA